MPAMGVGPTARGPSAGMAMPSGGGMGMTDEKMVGGLGGLGGEPGAALAGCRGDL